jgi:hypothetical protein
MALFDQNDAGGISASSRWLRSVSDDTTGRRRDIGLAPLPGCQQLFLDLMTGGVASLNHRLLALMPPASFCYGMSLF